MDGDLQYYTEGNAKTQFFEKEKISFVVCHHQANSRLGQSFKQATSA